MFKPIISVTDSEAVVYSDDFTTLVFPEPHRLVLQLDRKFGSFYSNATRHAIAEWVKSFETRERFARVSNYVKDFLSQIRNDETLLRQAFPSTWLLHMIDESITYKFLAKPEFSAAGNFQGPSYDEEDPAEWEDMFSFELLEKYLTELSEEQLHPKAFYDTYLMPFQDLYQGIRIHEDSIFGLHLSERVSDLIRKNIAGIINDRIVNFRTIVNLSFVGFGSTDLEPAVHRVNLGGTLGRFNLWNEIELKRRPLFVDATYSGGFELIENLGERLIADPELSFLSQAKLTKKIADAADVDSSSLAVETSDDFDFHSIHRVTKEFVVSN